MKLNHFPAIIRTKASLLVLGTLIAGSQAFASVIVNLDATSATASSVTQSLSAGTYSVTIVGTSVAGALYNGWNTSYGSATNNLWTDRYAIDTCGGSCNLEPVLANNPSFATATSALANYQAATTISVYNIAAGTTTAGYSNPYTFTLKSAQNVIFSIPDYGSYGDNTGGASLQLLQIASAPEPGTLGLLASAALVAGFVFRRRLVTGKA